MNQKQAILLTISCFILGALFIAYQQQWILLKFPGSNKKTAQVLNKTTIEKKQVTLFFWHQDAWQNEKIEAIWSSQANDTLQHIITRWLTLLDEDSIMNKKVNVQSVCIDSGGTTAYISFDRNPLDEQASMHANIMWIHGLLKTIHANNIAVGKIQFLVHHQPLLNNHLDFSKPWPTQGYVAY